MTCALPTTSDPVQQHWLGLQREFIDSLQAQPFLVVVRPTAADLEAGFDQSSLVQQLFDLDAAGLRHLEVAWIDHPRWLRFMQRLKDRFPRFQLGAASITRPAALEDLQRLSLAYAMAPSWDPQLVNEARRRGLLLVPGVFSPTEVQQARDFGCLLVKLFPAASLGPHYWQRLQAPLGDLPWVIAAGGLSVADVPQWIAAGHAAVALGRGVLGAAGLDPSLLALISGSPING